MSKLGTACVKCGRKFHACCSCGLFGEEWDYCSRTCYEDDGTPLYDIYGKCETYDLTKYCLNCNPNKLLPDSNNHVHLDIDENRLYCVRCGGTDCFAPYS